MTKQNEQEALGTAMNKTEMFFEKNSKSLVIALLVSVPYLVKDFVSVIIALGAAALIRSRIKVTAAANQ